MPAGAEAAAPWVAEPFKDNTTCLHQKCTVFEMDGSAEKRLPSAAHALDQVCSPDGTAQQA